MLRPLTIAMATLWMAGAAYGADFFLSPQGDDANSGTLDKPFKTLAQAHRAVRTVKAANQGETPVGGVTVWLRGGRYELAETFVLGPEDSGQEGRPVVYRSYQEERPVLSGGGVIRGWKKVDGELPGLPKAAQGKVWAARVPEAAEGKWSFRQLWAGGKRLTRAGGRTTAKRIFECRMFPCRRARRVRPGPAQDRWRESLKRAWRTAQFAADLKDFPGGKLPGDLGNRNAEVFAIIGGRWATMRVPVASVDGTQLSTAAPMGYFTYYWGGMAMMAAKYGDGGTGHIENALSLLDAPSEWYLDSTAGTVYYFPAGGEDPNAEEFVAPRLEQLLCIRGSSEAPVHFVEFARAAAGARGVANARVRLSPAALLYLWHAGLAALHAGPLRSGQFRARRTSSPNTGYKPPLT